MGASSPRSQQTAREVVAFFFAWFAVHFGGSLDEAQLYPPSRVQESDVVAFAKYLENGGSWVVPGFAGSDIDRRIVQWLENAGDGVRARWTEIYEALDKPESPELFADRLSNLVTRRQIARSPKRVDVQIVDKKGVQRALRPGDVYPIDQARFSAMPKKGRPAPGSVYARLSVLAGLFRAIMRPKNLPGESPVRANPVSATLLRWRSRRASEEVQRSERRKTSRADLELLQAVIERGGQRSSAVRARDRLLIEMLASMGLRVSEACSARRTDLGTIDAPDGKKRRSISVKRKGGKVQLLPLSPSVERALQSLDESIRMSARPKEVKEALLSYAAPVVPALGRWGKASRSAGARAEAARRLRASTGSTSRDISAAFVPMGRSGAERVFERYAREASREVPVERREEVLRALRLRWHPHGLRHLFAELAVDGGVPLRTVSEFLGHESTSQLERRYARRPDLAKFDFAPLIAAALQK